MSTKERKVALMGFRSVGKSSLTIQFVDNQFVDSYDPTIENTFQKAIRINGQDYNLELKDTAGQDEYSILPQSYFMNIDGYVLVYSVNSFKSFEVVKIIYEKLLDMKGSINRVPVVLVGNKSDLTLEREVQYEDGKKLASSWNVPFLETSAKENQSVAEIFSMVMMAILRAEGSEQKKGGCVLS
ncbi:hypothetical protein CHS0354_000969 [Potamilus streckersoni]|uniref:GTP-binding protein Rheb n=1 Tax=Potamilus streckersoni TaxID=2493646 RepID=A0AAE0WF48_9BIVA|nr:hypothetical protein CHS0354_000969 [Potamilus streckersoni]